MNDDRGERAHLINVAFRILRDIGAAEDAVQEAYARFLRADAGSIDDEHGWLVVVTSRICLDQLKSSRSRLDRAEAPDTFDARTSAEAAGVDPADRVTLDDEVRSALNVVLDRLSPAERVVFVMHDVFQVPFETIAEVVGRPASSCRQLASRARARIAGPSGTGPAWSAADLAVTDAFIAACAGGDLGALLAVLDPEVSGDGDFGPDLPAPLIVGADAVAHRTLGFLGHGATIVTRPDTDQPALLAFVDRRLLAIIDLTIEHGRITKLHADGRPESVRDLSWKSGK